jgi:hypothetical protein
MIWRGVGTTTSLDRAGFFSDISRGGKRSRSRCILLIEDGGRDDVVWRGFLKALGARIL